MLGAKRAVWLVTQAIRNDAARPRPASKIFMLLTNRPYVLESRIGSVTLEHLVDSEKKRESQYSTASK